MGKLQQRKRPPGRGGVRRPGTKAKQDGPPSDSGQLKIEPGAPAEAAPAIATQRAGLGVPLSADAEEERIIVMVDPQVRTRADRLPLLLGEDAALGKEAEVDPQVVAGRIDQMDAMRGYYLVSVQGTADVEDSRRAVAQVLRQMRKELDDALPRLLHSGKLSPEKRDLLEQWQQDIADEKASIATEQQQQTAETKKKNQAADDQVAREQRREAALRTILNVQAGAPASPDEVDQAYEEMSLEVGTEADRRDVGR